VSKFSIDVASWVHSAALILLSLDLSRTTSRSCETIETGLVYRVACPFTSQLVL